MKLRSKSLPYILREVFLYGVMGLYLLILFFLLFGKRDMGSFRSVNWIPFHEISAYLFGTDAAVRAFGLGNILGNVLIFMPLGFYLSLLHPKGTVLFHTALVMAFSAAAELLQYLFMVGASDIDDVILNTLGGLIGAGVFVLFQRLFRQNVRTAAAIFAPVGGVAMVVLLLLIN